VNDSIARYCWRCAGQLTEAPPTTCPHCGQGHYNNPKPAAEALLVKDGQILLIRRATEPFKGLWDIPGGFCDAGEHPAATAERELREETGHSGRVTQMIGIWMDTYGEPDPDGMQETTLNISFLLQPAGAGAAHGPDGEASELRWFALDAPPEDLAFPAHQAAVLRAAAALLSAGRAG
jgi:ADP-ribose pyrophosphatase YjhB (NUDIX family)